MSGIDIKWGDFAEVAIVAAAATLVIAISYAGGLRLLATARPDGPSGATHGAPMIGAVACFAVGILAVLYGLYLVIPQFH